MTTRKIDPLTRLVGPPDEPGATSTQAIEREAEEVASGEPASGRARRQARKDASIASDERPEVTGADKDAESFASTVDRPVMPLPSGSGHSAVDGLATDVDDDAFQGGSGDGTDDETLLDSLVPAIERARGFAEQWEMPYRHEIFRVALTHLLSGESAPHISSGGSAARAAKHIAGSLASVQGAGATGTARATGGPLSPMEKLSRALNEDADNVARAVHFEENGRIVILGRVGKAKKELQRNYALVYLYVKEIALGTRTVDTEELRTLCVDQGCYDVANFTSNFGKDVDAGLLRAQSEKGGRARRYMLTQTGVKEAAKLLREMVKQ